MFDFENLVSYFACLSYDNGKILVSRKEGLKWEIKGAEEFAEFCEHVCQLPHVKGLADADPESNIVPHSRQLIYCLLKTTLIKMVWQRLGSCTYKMFATKEGHDVAGFKNEIRPAKLIVRNQTTLNQLHKLEFIFGSIAKARIDEEALIGMLYSQKEISIAQYVWH